MQAQPQPQLQEDPQKSQQCISKQISINKIDVRSAYDLSSKPIGQGAFGVVHKATAKVNPSCQRVVKIINKRLVKDMSMLQRQIHILSKIDHPSIIKMHQIYDFDNCLNLVLDYWKGGDLFDFLLENGAIAQKRAQKLFKKAVESIKYLHGLKICHRDIKAENFLINSQNEEDLGLIDFGMAYEWKENMGLEIKNGKDNKIMGSTHYTAPQMHERNYDQRCDIWSLGVLLYTMVLGVPPFDGQTDDQIAKNVVKLKVVKDSQFDKLAASLKDLIERMLVEKEIRLSLTQVLGHAWLKEKQTAPQQQHQIKVQTFNKRRSSLKRQPLQDLLNQLASPQFSKTVGSLGKNQQLAHDEKSSKIRHASDRPKAIGLDSLGTYQAIKEHTEDDSSQSQKEIL